MNARAWFRVLILGAAIGCGPVSPAGGPPGGAGGGTGTGTGGGSGGFGGGGGGTGGTTGTECRMAEDCSYHACRCQDGAIVNSRTCNNGFCLNASSACPDGCARMGHGGWAGSTAGGGGGSSECSVSDDCPGVTCQCQNGRIHTARGCDNGSCEGASTLCPWACQDEGGW